MPSFDIVSEVEKTEVKNALEQTNKEVGTRFDFKGSDARVEQAALVLTVFADNEFQLDQVQDILNGKLAKRGVDIRSLDISDKIEKVSGNKVKRSCTVKVGVEIELAKDRQTPQGQQAQGAGQHPGRCRACHRQEPRRPAGGHRLRQENHY